MGKKRKKTKENTSGAFGAITAVCIMSVSCVFFCVCGLAARLAAHAIGKHFGEQFAALPAPEPPKQEMAPLSFRVVGNQPGLTIQEINGPTNAKADKLVMGDYHIAYIVDESLTPNSYYEADITSLHVPAVRHNAKRRILDKGKVALELEILLPGNARIVNESRIILRRRSVELDREIGRVTIEPK